MSDENKPSQVETVREPHDVGNSQTAAAVEPAESGGEPAAATAAGTIDIGNPPLAAYRRDRLRGRVSEHPADDSQEHARPSAPAESRPATAGGGAPACPIETSASEAPAQQPTAAAPAEAREPVAAGEGTPAEAPAATQPAHERPAPSRAVGNIELPPAIDHLDAALAAEIDAAMASSDLSGGESPAAAEIEAEGETTGEHPPEETLERGQHLTGRIQSIHGDGVLLDLGYRSAGLVPLRQFVSGKKPEVGQRIEVLVDRLAPDEGLIYLNLPKGLRRIAGNWDQLSKGQIVECIVNRTNKGGLEVTVSGLRAFLPSSQVELGFVSDLEPYVGQKLRVEVIEVNPKKRNLVVSRRAYLQIERKEAEAGFWETAAVDQTFTGKVKTVKDYGVFVDLGAVDGFLHIGEMSWQRLKHPSELVKEGQTVDVKILSLDREKKKIALGMKQLVQNPWSTAADKYAANSTVTGKVTRIADFGAFVELEPGLEGLVHVSELDHKHVRHASDVVKVHQVVTAQVLEVDPERKRISLSLKALLAKPESPKPVEESPAEAYQRKHKGPLRGGTGSGTPGGLFGNPSDYR